tara:strand:- start:4357 stop:5160 length:804 start_codon:yes stop_codon:yes gene_type:complete
MSTDLLDELNFNVDTLKQICPSIFTTPTTGTSLGTLNMDVDFKGLDSDDMFITQRKYYDKVEEGNVYMKELLEIEKEYFEKKYGPKIYQHIQDKRSEYETTQFNTKFGNSSEMSVEERKEDLSNNMTLYKSFGRDLSSNINMFENNLSILEKDLNRMINESERTKRKVEYRNEVSDEVVEYSTKATYVYYFLLLCIFIFLFSQNKLNLKNHILLYGFALIFPFLYRYLFLGLVYVYNVLNEKMDLRGPKNAFLDESVKLTFLDDYDI